MWLKVKLLLSFTRDSSQSVLTRTIYVTNAAIKPRMNYIITAAVFDSCPSRNLLPDTKIIAWMLNRTTVLQKWNTVHDAWMNYGCRLTRISISGVFDKAERDLSMWEAEGNKNFTGQFTCIDAFCWENVEWVTAKRNDEDWQCGSLSSFKVITAERMINTLLSFMFLIHCWKIFLAALFFFFSVQTWISFLAGRVVSSWKSSGWHLLFISIVLRSASLFCYHLKWYKQEQIHHSGKINQTWKYIPIQTL